LLQIDNVPLVPAFKGSLIIIVTVDVLAGQTDVDTVYEKTYGLAAAVNVLMSTVPKFPLVVVKGPDHVPVVSGVPPKLSNKFNIGLDAICVEQYCTVPLVPELLGC